MGLKTVVLGLTGQTGAGKTTASKWLREKRIPVIDADEVARDVVAKGTKCLSQLALEFSCMILNIDGTLNRKVLGDMVFSDREKLRKLNKITFPYIIDEIHEKIKHYKSMNEPIIVLDAPTLFESGADRFCDKVVSVIAPEDLRRSRIMKRDSLTKDQATNRILSQHDDEYYIKKSDYVLVNEAEPEKLKAQLEKLLMDLTTN